MATNYTREKKSCWIGEECERKTKQMESRSSYPVLNLIAFTTMHHLGGVLKAAGRCNRLMAETEEEAEEFLPTVTHRKQPKVEGIAQRWLKPRKAEARLSVKNLFTR